MVTASDIVGEATGTNNFLEEMRRLHKARLRTGIRNLEDKMINLMSDLDSRPGGKLEGIKINLKQSQKIHAKMVNIFEEEYGQTVSRMVGEYGQIAQHIKRSWRSLGESVQFTDVDKAMLTSLQGQAYDQFSVFGEAAQRRMADAMYSSVVAGASYAQLLNTVKGILRGHTDVRGRSMLAYADTHAFDAIMNFHNDVNIKKSEDLGIKKFMYVGDIITTTRPFCRRRAGKFYTRAQIDRWNTLSWSGKSGPPFTHRGGYNCRHHWRGMKDDWLDEGEFGVIDDDEMFAHMKAKDQPDVLHKITEKEALKRKHADSQVKTKALKVERGKLKGRKLTNKDKKRLSEIKMKLNVEKNTRRKLKTSIINLKSDLKEKGKKLREALSPPIKPTKPIIEEAAKKPLTDVGELNLSADLKSEYKFYLKALEKDKNSIQKIFPEFIAERGQIGRPHVFLSPAQVKSKFGKVLDAKGLNQYRFIRSDINFFSKKLADLEDLGSKVKLKAIVKKGDNFIWSKSKDIDKISAQLSELGLGDIVPSDFRDVEKLREIYNSIGSEVVYLKNKFKKLGWIRKKPLNWFKIVAGRGDDGITSSYYHKVKGMEMFGGNLSLTRNRLYLGKKRGFFSENGIFGDFRHEYGHHVQVQMSKDPTQKRMWSKFQTIHKKLGGDEVFEKIVTPYAGANVQEAFAECFSIFTDPIYGTNKAKRLLPKELHDYFKELLI